MPNLEARLREVMQSKGWEHADVVRISGQSSSVVSQWLGGTKKEIKRIARVSAAVRLAEASGYSAEWIAEGIGPKHRTGGTPPAGLANHAAEAGPGYGVLQLLDDLERVLQQVPAEQRDAVAINLAGWVRDGGAAHWKPALLALLALPAAARKRA